MQNYYRAGGLIGSSLSIPTGRGKAVYILPSSDPTFALLLVGFTEYDDDDDDDDGPDLISAAKLINTDTTDTEFAAARSQEIRGRGL
ncbi:hypothetical protein Hanom_Chr15g01350431 [Helianthus anomalus]